MNQFRALLKKNWLLKTSNLIDTAIEYLIPVILCLFLILGASILPKDDINQKKSYFVNVVLRSSVPLLSGNCCRFILHQVVKEREVGILRSLVVMNMSSIAYGFSFIIIQ